MIYRVQYILLGCLKHSLPCSIQQTTSQGCDNTWFLRIICTLYSHHLHHHRCKKWGGIGGTFLVSNLVFLGGGSQNKVMLCTKLDAYSLSNLAKSLNFFLLRLKIIYIKKTDICLIILIQNYLNTISNQGFAKKKVKIQLTSWWCI